jgi:hypothetical protein
MSVRSSGYQVSPSHVGSTSSPTPYSRFAVRYVHGFCLMLPSDTPLSGNALALSASSFRPVTADHHAPGFAWNCSLCVMPGTRFTARQSTCVSSAGFHCHTTPPTRVRVPLTAFTTPTTAILQIDGVLTLTSSASVPGQPALDCRMHDCRDAGARAPRVGALSDAWSGC